MRGPTAATRVAAVIGDPVGHSLSPVIHNAAFAAAQLDWVYVALHVRAGEGAAAIDGMRTLGIDGLSVTMPHKEAVIPALDRLSEEAERLGAVNCVSRQGDLLVGDNTDGEGFLAGLRDDFAFDPAGRTCVVLGAGGAARAAVLALATAGAAAVQVVNRTEDRAREAAALAGPVGSVEGPEVVADADLVVNATSVGMRSADGSGDWATALPCDADRLGSGQVVADLVYHPLRTALMDAAAQRGATTSNGLSMLIHQAAAAFARWTGQPAPIEVMRAAVQDRLDTPERPTTSKS